MGRQQEAKDTKPRAPREKRIAAPEETADLRFRESLMASPYRDLLEELQDAPHGSTLKIARQARYTVVKWVRELGLKVLWARRDGDLYLKIVGEAEVVEKPLTIAGAVREAAEHKDTAAARPAAALAAVGHSLEERVILAGLKQAGPQTLRELARSVAVTPVSCKETMARLIGRGEVEEEDGVFRLKAAKK